MNFEIKIFGRNNSKTLSENESNSGALRVYRIREITKLVEDRYQYVPEVAFDSKFDKKNTIFLLFGSIPPSEYKNVKAHEERIFYFQHSFIILIVYWITSNLLAFVMK